MKSDYLGGTWGPWAKRYDAMPGHPSGIRLEVDLGHGINLSGTVRGRGLHLGFMPPTPIRRWADRRHQKAIHQAIAADQQIRDAEARARNDAVRRRVTR